jgi:DNA-binding NarL/FixJ family response regulator
MRVFVIESQPHVRAALQFLLSQQSDIDCVGSVGAEPDIAGKLALLAPDVIVLDWDLPQQSASRLLALVHRLPDQPRMVVLGSRPEVEQRALSAGADAFVSKIDSPDAVLSAVRSVYGGGTQPGEADAPEA